MRIGLIGCCKEKLDYVAPAKELYQSDLFKKSMNWITKPGRVDQWSILSSFHGLVLPDQIIAPYELSLDMLDVPNREKWSQWVHKQLMDQWGEDVIYMVLAGHHYRQALKRMPLVEDVIGSWTSQRQEKMGSSRGRMGIGVIKRYLKEDRSFGV